MPFADLHMHSTASDGTYNATQILEEASQHPEIGAIAITDHDNLEASLRARQLAPDYDLEFVPGVEITTKHEGRGVHMLGYFVDAENKALGEFLRANRDKRMHRACAMADRLCEAGYPISSADIESAAACANRPLLARLLVERGCAESVDDAFSRLIGVRSPHFVEVEYQSTIEAMRLIREAGGYPFIAHPARYKVVDLIRPLSLEGLAGVEAYHTHHSPEQSCELVAIAHDLGLGISGGSDWHGDEVHAASLGGSGLDYSSYLEFLRSCDRG